MSTTVVKRSPLNKPQSWIRGVLSEKGLEIEPEVLRMGSTLASSAQQRLTRRLVHVRDVARLTRHLLEARGRRNIGFRLSAV